MVDGLAGAHIGTHHKKVHGVLPESLGIKEVQLFRHGMVAELLAVQVAGAQQIAKAGVAQHPALTRGFLAKIRKNTTPNLFVFSKSMTLSKNTETSRGCRVIFGLSPLVLSRFSSILFL